MIVMYVGGMDFYDGLTTGKTYEVVKENETQYVVNNDLGAASTITKDKFLNGWLKGMANKFCGIIKHEDAVKYLNDKDKADFNYLCNKIEMGRSRDGKRPVNAYLVINIDEPYAEEVADVLKRNGHWG